jgi:chemotaxis protein CheZ
VTALKAIESRISSVVSAASGMAGPNTAPAVVATEVPKPQNDKRTEGEKLANGPQLPGSGVSQSEIDRLLASFD